MRYWIAFKINDGKKMYVVGIDKTSHNIIHTEDENEALKIRQWEVARSYQNFGYCIRKEEV